MSKYEDIKQIFEERVKKETFTMLCYEENSKSSMIISSKENFNYDDVCKDLKTSDTLFIFEKNKTDTILLSGQREYADRVFRLLACPWWKA